MSTCVHLGVYVYLDVCMCIGILSVMYKSRPDELCKSQFIIFGHIINIISYTGWSLDAKNVVINYYGINYYGNYEFHLNLLTPVIDRHVEQGKVI